jgi:hypothetical protein
MLVSSDWGEQPDLGRGVTETGRAGGNPRKSVWALRFVGYYELGDLWAQPCCNGLSGLSGNVRDYKVCEICFEEQNVISAIAFVSLVMIRLALKRLTRLSARANNNFLGGI